MKVNAGISTWFSEADALLGQLGRLDLGYPIGKNWIRPPASPDRIGVLLSELPENVASGLAAFYSLCDGFSWPDVKNGYFIESVERLISAEERGEPNTLSVRGAKSAHSILVVGTDGGGGRLWRSQKKVHH